MEGIFCRWPPTDVDNVDETRWCLTSSHEITIAPRGVESVTANFSGNPKVSLTAIAIITAAGEKLPLHVICKGTTTRCERKYQHQFHRQIAKGRLILCHQHSGWTDKNVAKSVIDCVANHSEGRQHCLLWDVFSAHRDEELKMHAPTRLAEPVSIPPGSTDRHQPLDRRIFGNLKSRARPRFEALWMRDPGHELTLLGVVEILLDVWNNIGQDEVLDAWSELAGENH
jgi:hypothetical protein